MTNHICIIFQQLEKYAVIWKIMQLNAQL